MSTIDLRHGDCLELMRAMPDNSVDSVVTDPPYGLNFLGKAWDKGVPSCEVWKEALRVLKPGGHLLAFAGTRTQHRMACAIEDAGFEIRDMIAWVYGSGFPKSLNISKMLDKMAGAEREVVGESENIRPNSDRGNGLAHGEYGKEWNITAPATEAAKQWEGWGSALKPALEPITVARKPLAKGNTIAANVLEYGTGAINVDGCRVEADGGRPNIIPNQCAGFADVGVSGGSKADGTTTQGRWPANLIHSGCQEVLDLFPETGAAKAGFKDPNGTMGYHGGTAGLPGAVRGHNDNGGSAARFYYCAKASKKDRDEGCEGLEAQNNMRVNGPRESEEAKHETKRANHHPTVKPTALMQYLCRLVTPPNGTVLDPFMGSGSTGKAAVLEGFNFIGCELDAEYIEIAKARINAALINRNAKRETQQTTLS